MDVTLLFRLLFTFSTLTCYDTLESCSARSILLLANLNKLPFVAGIGCECSLVLLGQLAE